jgi:hypothetical protein
MNEEQPPSTPPGDVTNSPIVGGTLLDALDAALEAAWADDRWIEALLQNEELIEILANLETEIETLRLALRRIA